MKAFVFAGTTEGREFVSAMKDELEMTVFVVTEEAKKLLDYDNVQVGKKDKAQITSLLDDSIHCIIDATHPYARSISTTLLEIAEEIGIPYYRLKRTIEEVEGFETYQDMVVYLKERSGNILLTTGANSAKSFVELKERVYLRMLPIPEKIREIMDMGYAMHQLICMQGPFSENMNKAFIEDLNIQYVITKSSGETGGFPEKKKACMDLNREMLILKPPHETGYSMHELMELLRGK